MRSWAQACNSFRSSCEGAGGALGLWGSTQDSDEIWAFNAYLVIQNVPEQDAARMWFGLFAPKGTPAAVVTPEHRATEVLKQPALRDKLAQQGIDPSYSTATPEQMNTRILHDEIVRWKALALQTAPLN